ncbi:hypothetical protein COO60DRAFT_774458 [Scenedesmus sp. NREL 46B-D3]|nr:hypothetical protein COO60DRAFT_774458 [Scenedesmus sp. NREL 46B-D3]
MGTSLSSGSPGCMASPLSTQPTGSTGPHVLLHCLQEAGVSTADGCTVACCGSRSTGMAAAAALPSPRQQQGVAGRGLSPRREQHTRLSSSAGAAGAAAAATGSGRLSPYASSLLAPVCCNIAYTLTPRSAAAAAAWIGVGVAAVLWAAALAGQGRAPLGCG